MNLQQFSAVGLSAALTVVSVESGIIGNQSQVAIASDLAADLASDLQIARSFPSLTNPPGRPNIAQPDFSQLDSIYLLGPGDVIQVEIFNVPEYSGRQRILADGSINVRAVGAINLSGLTVSEAGSAIAAAYQSELRYPQATVVLESPRPLRVAIAGEVVRPGSYTLTPANEAQFPTVSQALQTAGGVTQAADLYTVRLQRNNGQGGSQTITLDLWALLNNGDVRQDLALRDGDTLFISETASVDLAETNRIADSNLAISTREDITVAVVGEVFQPGAHEFEGEQNRGNTTTITQAIQTAGGVKPSADIRNIQVRRRTRSGTDQIIDIDFWQLLQDGDLSQDLILQQGDTVIIPVANGTTPGDIAQLTAANISPEEVRVNVVGEVASPGALELSPRTTLNQAVLAAGGFTNRAKETVELIRLNPDGSVTQRQIEVTLTEGLDPERNPLILNNDVVLVGRNARARISDSVGSIAQPLIQLLTPWRLLF